MALGGCGQAPGTSRGGLRISRVEKEMRAL